MTTMIFILGAGLTLGDFIRSERKIKAGIERNDYGKGDRIEELKVRIADGRKTPIRVEVSEREYTSKEIREVFQRCIRQMESLILGRNESLDRVEYDLNLLTRMPDEPVDISWELDRYDVMNVNGDLRKDELVPEGTKVMLKAVLTYQKNRKEQTLYECAAMVYPRSNDKEGQSIQVEEAVRKADEKTRNKKVLQLPRKLDGEELAYYPLMEERGIVLMVMAFLIAILLYASEKQKKVQDQQRRKQQMILDYPEIINKLTLFLGAGMTVKRAWKKIVQDYEEQMKVWGTRFAYEEMKKTCYEMDSGITEAESYVRFGRRCNIQEYVRMGALLSQNLRRGTKGLNQILRLEAIQAFEERKARAKQLGEEAGTKLLVPMFMMLAVVLVMVIIPAFLSVQI